MDQGIQERDGASGHRDDFWPELSAWYAIEESQQFRNFPLCHVGLRSFDAGNTCEKRLRFEHEGDKRNLEGKGVSKPKKVGPCGAGW